ncbi:MAG: hypothetical protein H7A40_03975 [Chlamydiales bacterium]|nr:hypothetical protein [Chlamydiales bacterium]
MNAKDIPRKANRVLYLITVSLLLIFVRVWYLQTSARAKHVKRARAPRERVFIQQPFRGAIYDRFGLPLAINRTQFNAAVCYSPIRDIPYIRWTKDDLGKRCKIFARKNYIEDLSAMLAKELHINAQDIEDRIYSRAAIFPNTPYVLKAGIDEKTYARLKMQERHYPGLIAECGSKRCYPQSKVGSHIIGYLGAIDDRKYSSVGRELESLKQFLKAREDGLPALLPKGYKTAKAVKERYETLKQQAYTINAHVGKGGVEQAYDSELRGISGRQVTEVDVKGKSLRKLLGSQDPLPGKSLTLSISAELQAYAEELLAITEKMRDDNFSRAGKEHDTLSGPFIKGGAIVALDPLTGEVIACASYPRFDSNDFVQKDQKISQWLETPTYIGQIWDGISTLEKEFESNALLSKPLTWECYLDCILTKNSSVRRQLDKIKTVQQSIKLQEAVDVLLHFSEHDSVASLINALYPTGTTGESILELGATTKIKESLLDPYLKPIPYNADKLLFLDLIRLNADRKNFQTPLAESLPKLTLDQHRHLNQAAAAALAKLRPQAQALFHMHDFAQWRKDHFSNFLKDLRAEERKNNRFAKPYLDYLIKEERAQFTDFWNNNKFALLNAIVRNSDDELCDHLKPYFQDMDGEHLKILREHLGQLPPQVCYSYLRTLVPFQDLTDSLYGKYRLVKSENGISQLKHLAAAFYPPSSFGYGKSHAYQQSAPPGSVFKIATAYAGLKEHYEKTTGNDPNPLTLFDETCPGDVLGHFPDGKKIPRLYKGGRLPRSHGYIGKVDLKTAMERSSNIYFSILAGDCLTSAQQLLDAAKELGYGSLTGIDLPGEFRGTLPTDLLDNRTGLYSFAIGQHAFDGTPLQTAVMLSAIANEGKIVKPHVLKQIQGPKLHLTNNPFDPSSPYPFQNSLKSLGIHFPLFTKTLQLQSAETDQTPDSLLVRTLFLPQSMRGLILDSLHRVVNGEMGSARPNRIKALYHHKGWMDAYKSVQQTLCGKTSTAEFRYHPTLEKESSPITCKHAWFGGISFNPNYPGFTKPELVVVVLQRFADYGKEAAPLAALMVKKWRELNQIDNR